MAGRRLGALGRVSNWLIGDWVREGVARWGEKYAEASKITGFDPHSLRNMAYVASRFDLSLRRDNLTWSHHALVAALDRAAQAYWLDQTSVLRWSVSDLRTMMRSARGATAVGRSADSVSEPEARPEHAATEEGESARSSSLTVKCPHCGTRVALSRSLWSSL
jgi:hypothetical protein